MRGDDALAMLDLFRGHQNIGMLDVRSAGGTITVRRSSTTPGAVQPSGHRVIDVTASTVGVVHLRPADRPRLVVGTKVEKGQELGSLDTAGNRGAILGPESGIIKSIEVVDDQFVEFGEVLFCLIADASDEREKESRK